MPTLIQDDGNIYVTVAASQSSQVLTGPSAGKQGDYLKRIVIVPATTGAGSVSITDGSNSAISVYVTGTLVDLKPFSVEIGAQSTTGAWKVTTGANVSVIAVGRFS